jgi:predicted ATP-grasp superfamily ATP-dependent carboligase
MNKPGAIIIEGHVQGLSNTRSLGEVGIPVYVVDKTDCIARHSKYCKKFFRSPNFIKDDFADFLVDLAANENIQDWVLIPSNDHSVYTLSKHKSRLEKYYKIITQGLEIIDKIYDKIKLIEIAKKINIPIPETHTFKSVNEPIKNELSFPVITKGRNGLSFYQSLKKKAFLAENEEQLWKQLQIINNNYFIEGSFTQELIPFDGNNKTISFTAFCENGEIKTHWSGIKLREHPIQFGTASFTKSTYVKECHEQSIPLLRELNYTGVCEVEYLKDPRNGEYKLIEINPRTWLWVELAKACGIDYAKMIYNYVNGLKNHFPNTYDTNRYWINPFSDTAYALPAIIKGQLRLYQYFSSLLKGKKENALYKKHDKRPAFAYLFNIFSFLKNR